jgi:hypothetical protein
MIPSRQKLVDEIAKVFPALPRNVFIIPPESKISTYAVMEQCGSVIIFNTKTGIELSSHLDDAFPTTKAAPDETPPPLAHWSDCSRGGGSDDDVRLVVKRLDHLGPSTRAVADSLSLLRRPCAPSWSSTR